MMAHHLLRRVRAGRDDASRGAALVAVLLILVIFAGSSASFIWFMNQQQTRAGVRLRSAAALAAAEAGVHRALAIFESVAPDGRTPGRAWRTAAYSESFPVGALAGRFTLSIAEEGDGAIVVTSAGEVAGTVRRLRARVYLASPALLAALYGTFIRLESPPAAVVILPYATGIADRRWVHIAAERGIWLAATDIFLNNPTRPFETGPGPVAFP